MIIAIAGEEVGAAKPALCANLAAMRAGESRRVLLLDGDTRKRSLLWTEERRAAGRRPRIRGEAIARHAIARQLESLAAHHDDVFVDIGGGNALPARSASVFAHTLIVLLAPGRGGETLRDGLGELLDTARLFNPRLRVLFMMISPEADIPMRAFAAAIAGTRLTDAVICPARPLYRTFANGLTLAECQPAEADAVRALEQLYRQVFTDEDPLFRQRQQAIADRGFREQVARLRGVVFKFLP